LQAGKWNRKARRESHLPGGIVPRHRVPAFNRIATLPAYRRGMDQLTAYRAEQSRQLALRRHGEDRRKALQQCVSAWQERRTGDRRTGV
jgi:hypothetical protein